MKNPFGTISKQNSEWSRSGRKQEDHYRGFRRTALEDALVEYEAEVEVDEPTRTERALE